MSPHNVRVGQRVTTAPETLEYEVISLHDNGVVAYEVTLEPCGVLVFIPFEHLVMPEQPKAEAGVLYRRRGENDWVRWVGLANGTVAQNDVIGQVCYRGFDPDEFTKLEPQP